MVSLKEKYVAYATIPGILCPVLTTVITSVLLAEQRVLRRKENDN